MKKSIAILLLIMAFVGFSFSMGLTQSKSNFVGTWKMNQAKSTFSRGGPEGLTIKFDALDPFITESIVVTTDQGDRTTNLKYTTDGKEAAAEYRGGPAQVSAKWEGDTLIVLLKAGEGRTFNRKITVSPDGKTMTVIARIGRNGEEESVDTAVLEKQ